MRGIISRLLGSRGASRPSPQSSEELQQAHARLSSAASDLSATIDDTFAELVRRSTGTKKTAQTKRRRRS